uniref:Uncharacterized protein n=1 Tax=viral metagenome TaxID=1070528 RepID=A0A6C0E7W8_9ZZZZ
MFSLENIKKELGGLQIDWKTPVEFSQLLNYKSYREIPSKIKELGPPEFSFENLTSNSYIIIGSRQINKSFLKPNTPPEMDFFYLIKPKDNDNHIYISIGFSEPVYWYYSNDLNKLRGQVEELILSYNMVEGEDFMIRTYAFIGTEAIKNNNMIKIEERLLKSDYAESLLWGSYYSEYPFDRKKMVELSGSLFLKNLQEAMKQYENYYSVSTRTMYSKSTIKITKLNGIYSVMIKYHPLNFRHTSITYINNTLGRYYTEDLPIDVIMVLHDYAFVDYLNIIEHSKPKYEIAFQILDQILPSHENNHINRLISNVTLLCYTENDPISLNKLIKYKNHLSNLNH